MFYNLKDLDDAIYQKKANFFGKYAYNANALAIDRGTAEMVKSAQNIRGDRFSYHGLQVVIVDTNRTFVSVMLK